MAAIHRLHNCPFSLCILLAILWLTPESLPAQYQPMVVDSSNWVVFVGVVPNDGRIYTIYGDTVIDNISYKKLYERVLLTSEARPDDVNRPFEAGSPRLRGFLRDDSKLSSVYGRIYKSLDSTTTLSADTLLHNFGASIGDTVFGYDYGAGIVIEDTSTVLRFGQLRKVFTGEFADSLIEGVGSTVYGPIGAQNVQLTEGARSLLHYCVGSLPDCGIDQLVSLTNNRRLVHMSAFPIPTADYLMIEFDVQQDFQPSTISILTTSGKELIRVTPSQVRTRIGTFQLSVETLPSGTYILQAYSNSEVGIVKFVKK